MKKSKFTTWTTMLAVLLTFVCLADGAVSVEPQSSTDIIATAKSAGQFESLLKALDAADLTAALQGSGPFTVLAPTDEAFAKIPKEDLDALFKPENKHKLARILKRHVISGKLSSKDLQGIRAADTIQGTSILVKEKDGQLYVSKAQVTEADIQASNGVIHVIDTVIMPMDIAGLVGSCENLSTLLQAAKQAGLVRSLQEPNKDITLFAPTNDAFSKLPAGTVDDLLKPENRDKLVALLNYHVVARRVMLKPQPAADKPDSGAVQAARANPSQVIVKDIITSNGVVQVLDRVLIPPIAQVPDATPAMSSIQQSVDKGAPLYNSGQSKSSSQIFREAANTLLKDHADSLDAQSKDRLNTALSEAQRDKNTDSQSWILRQALGDVYQQMGQQVAQK